MSVTQPGPNAGPPSPSNPALTLTLRKVQQQQWVHNRISPLLNDALFKKKKLIYLFLAALGLHCCMRAFSSCGERGLLFVGVRGLLIAVASLVAEHGL